MGIRVNAPILKALVCILLFASFSSNQSYAQAFSGKQLEKAIATLRHIVPSKLDDAQKDKRAEEIDNAWKAIRDAGKGGIARLKQELQKVKISKESDDFFKLNAAALLWQIGKFDEVPTIVEIWKSTPLDVQYTYVFLTAFEAALTQDERALPLLEACLHDRKGEIFIPLHSMNLELHWLMT